MTDQTERTDPATLPSGGPPWRRTLAACLVILAIGAAIIAVVFSTEPQARREGATRRTPMLVDVVEVARATHRPRIVAMGTVEPAQDVILRPRVRGEVVERAPAFTPGGFVARGEMLVRLDPDDYDNLLRQRQSDLSQAVADLELEMGRQNVAQLDYQLLEEDLTPENEELVLRQPQLLAARARVEAARAAVRQAELDLARTRVTAPFDAHVLTREVAVGSQVAAGDALGRLVGVDHYWVVTTLPRQDLRWLDLPETPGERGARVEIHDPAAWADGVTRSGYLYSHVGALDQQTRLARVLVNVPDPLARQRQAGADTAGIVTAELGTASGVGRPPLTVGAYVEARIPGRPLSGVVRLARDLVRQQDTVWVMAGDTLAIRDVEVVFRDQQHAYIRRGLEDGDRVVVTNLATVTSGAPLRLQPATVDTTATTAAATETP
jgi:RND family efflux transporter MFP subunit